MLVPIHATTVLSLVGVILQILKYELLHYVAIPVLYTPMPWQFCHLHSLIVYKLSLLCFCFEKLVASMYVCSRLFNSWL